MIIKKFKMISISKMTKKIFFSVLALASFLPFMTPKAKADYSFSGPSSSWGQSTSESSFSVNTDSMTCSSGGGTAPSLWVGVQGGEGVESDSDSNRDTNEIFNGGVAVNIPLGNRANKGANCSELLAIMEAEEFLSMMKSLKELNALDEDKAAMLIRTYMDKTGQKIGIDFKKVIKSDLGSEYGLD